MGAASKKNASQYHRMLKVVESNTGTTVLDQKEPFLKKTKAKSGVRAKVASTPEPVDVVEQKADPKQYLLYIHYHYFAAVFPEGLKFELLELEDFFGIRRNQRGEGTTVQCERLLATISYRFKLGPVEARGFRKTLCNLLKRYGIEIVHSELDEA